MTEFFLGTNKSEKTKKMIGKILLDYINNSDFFEGMGINEISDRYHICHKSLGKYLKIIFKKNKEKKNGKLINIDHNLFLFLNDLNSIHKTYNGHLTNKEIEIGKNFLNNLKS